MKAVLLLQGSLISNIYSNVASTAPRYQPRFEGSGNGGGFHKIFYVEAAGVSCLHSCALSNHDLSWNTPSHQHGNWVKQCPFCSKVKALADLFFTRFNFTVNYQPGNIKLWADALSRIHSTETSTNLEATQTEPLCREVLRDSHVCHPLCVCPSWTQYKALHDMGIQEASKPSRSSITNTGCPV